MQLAPSFLALAICVMRVAFASPVEDAGAAVAEAESGLFARDVSAYSPPKPQPEEEDECPVVPICEQAAQLAIPVYQMWNTHRKDSYYTTDPASFDGHLQERYTKYQALVPWKVLAKRLPGTVPIYVMYNPSPAIQDHFYTTSEAEREKAAGKGYVNRGILGFAFKDAQCGAVPLCQLWLGHLKYQKKYAQGNVYTKTKSYQDHIYTIDPKIKQSLIKTWQYVPQGEIGFVFKPTVKAKGWI
ncbi:hypothetical protein HGRIS_014640 [Hohenbuehelia grisea]|uniref:DUF5648 domain-containing protein n=1 Tax=Hohenbuehelia grisea TaxID=104357 RepID=A0ABR3JV00_9AGAR